MDDPTPTRLSLVRDGPAVALLIAAIIARWRQLGDPTADPDYFFHLAVARQTAEHGLMWTFPQLAGTGFDIKFVDKEFLFHALLGAIWRMGGEQAVVSAVLPTLLVATVLALYAAARTAVSSGVACLAVLLVSVASDWFVFRMMLLRPHVLAVLCLALLLLALQRKGRALAFASTAAFALAYHALYIPGLVLVVFALFAQGDRALRNACLAGLAGLVVGLVANPYFPGTVEQMIDHMRVGLDAAYVQELNQGVESRALLTSTFLEQLGGLCAAIVAAAAVPWLLPSAQRRRLAPHLIVAVALLALSMQTPRAAEHAVPVAALLFALALDAALGVRLLAIALIGGVLAGQLWQLRAPRLPFEHRERLAFAALDAMPADAAGSVVFNCSWAAGPFILYARPDVRTLDAETPTFMAAARPRESALRQRLLRDDLPDPRAVLGVDFGARYALCRTGPELDALESDPHFVRLFPKTPRLNPAERLYALYRVDVAPLPQFITQFELSAPVEVPEGAPQARPLDALAWGPADPVPGAAWLDLRRYFPAPPKAPGSGICVAVRVVPEETSRLAGATLLGVGGGLHVRVWRNGEPLFSSSGGFSRPRLIQSFVPLEPPLTETDVLVAEACSPGVASQHGVALSAWTDAGVAASCAERGVDLGAAADGWTYRSRRATCLGPLAAPTVRAP